MQLARWLACAAALSACGGGEAPPTSVAPIVAAASAPPVPPSTAAAPPRDPCDVAHARAALVLDPVMARIADHVTHADTDDARDAWSDIAFSSLRCVPAGRGAWIALPTTASIEYVAAPIIGGSSDPIDTFALRATAVVAYITPEGTWSTGNETFHPSELPSDGERARLTIDDTFDFDADGIAEVFVTYDDEAYESHTVRHLLLAVTGDRVHAYPRSADIDIVRVLDADEDGRPDLVSARRYWHVMPCGAEVPDVGAPTVLFHALPDGSFSASDEIAARYLRTQCPAPPRELLVGGDCGEITTQRIACARAWGASAEDVRSRLETEQAALSPGSAAALAALADWTALEARVAIDPPLVLTP